MWNAISALRIPLGTENGPGVIRPTDFAAFGLSRIILVSVLISESRAERHRYLGLDVSRYLGTLIGSKAGASRVVFLVLIQVSLDTLVDAD